MKTNFKNPFTRLGVASREAWVLPALIAVLNLIPAGRAMAQFDRLVNSDGAFPAAGLVLSGNTLYGTAQAGGSFGWGEVFALNTDGSGFTNLHSFTGSDGMNPYGQLMISGDTLFGTTSSGGSTGDGTVFKVNADGNGFATLHNFSATAGSPSVNSDGAEPYAGVVLLGNTLYGTAEEGGTAGEGTVFAVNADGTQFTNLDSFGETDAFGINSGGAEPKAALLQSGNTLYGTAYGGGSAGNGTVFALNIDGTGGKKLYSFKATRTNSSGIYTNKDGANPAGSVVLSGSTLYGTAENGGSTGGGTVFAVNTDGNGFRVLHDFTALDNHTNSDGALPHTGLLLSGNTLYGTAKYGGSSGNGTVFAIHTDGTGFTNLYSFTFLSGPAPGTNNDGTYPYGSLILSGQTLYGTALFGGSLGNGTVFAVGTDGTGFTTLHSFTKLAMPVPQLTIALSGTSVVLAWPADTGPTYYRLESATDVLSPDSMPGNAAWNPVSVTPVIVNGQKIVTISATEAQRFFCLDPVAGGCGSASDCPFGMMCVGGVCMEVTGGGLPGFGFIGGFFGGFNGFNGICSGCGG